MDFSEREGHKQPKHNPLESMDAGLKNAIWTVIYTHIDNRYISVGVTGYGDTTYRDTKAKNLWTDYFEQSISSLPYAGKYLNEIEELYSKLEWYEVYGLIEYFLEQNEYFSPEEFNKVLAKHNAAYRVIDSIVQPISDKEVINAMESAHNNALSDEIREHLHKAQKLFSDKKTLILIILVWNPLKQLKALVGQFLIIKKSWVTM